MESRDPHSVTSFTLHTRWRPVKARNDTMPDPGRLTFRPALMLARLLVGRDLGSLQSDLAADICASADLAGPRSEFFNAVGQNAPKSVIEAGSPLPESRRHLKLAGSRFCQKRTSRNFLGKSILLTSIENARRLRPELVSDLAALRCPSLASRLCRPHT